MSESESTLRRFSDQQVYVHLVTAAAILWLLLTGMAITFAEYVPWILTLIGHQRLIFAHVVGGVALVTIGLYYVFYAVSGLATGDFPTEWLPTLTTVREGFQFVKYVLGRGPKPESDKYTFIQKSEIIIVMAEITVLSVTGLLLTFPSLLVQYKPAFLIFSDVHALVAFTLLIGITYHLFDTHVQHYPLERTMFTGKISVSEAREKYSRWVDPGGKRTDGGEVVAVDSDGIEIPVVGAVLAIFFFVMIYLGLLVRAVLSPLPTGEYVVGQLEPEGLLSGPLWVVFAVAFNLIALVLVASLVALGYGMYIRFTERSDTT